MAYKEKVYKYSHNGQTIYLRESEVEGFQSELAEGDSFDLIEEYIDGDDVEDANVGPQAEVSIEKPDFTKGLAISADAGSEPEAQVAKTEITDLQLEDGSSDYLSSDVDTDEFELDLSGIQSDELLNNIEEANEEFSIEEEQKENAVKSLETIIKRNLSKGAYPIGEELGLDTDFNQSLENLSNNPDFKSDFKDYVMEIYNFDSDVEIPQEDIDTVVNGTLSDAINKEKQEIANDNNEVVSSAEKRGDYGINLNVAIQNDIASSTGAEREVMKLNKKAQTLRLSMSSGDEGDQHSAYDQLFRIEKEIETIKKKDGWKESHGTAMFNLVTNKRVNKAEQDYLILQGKGDQLVDKGKELEIAKERLQNKDYVKIQDGYYVNASEKQSLERALDKKIDLKPSDNWAGLGSILTTRGYDKVDGVYKGVTTRDLLSIYNLSMDKGSNLIKDLEASIYNNTGEQAMFPASLIDNLRGLSRDQKELNLESEAYKSVYLLNVDPGTRKQGLLEGITRFGETALEATIGEQATEVLGTSLRKELDVTERIFEEQGVDLSSEQKENFKRSLAMKVTEGVGAFVPELVKFAAINPVVGGILRTASFGIRLATMLRTGTRAEKIFAHSVNALIEEGKFKLATGGESQTGGGIGFYAGGKLMQKILPFRFSGDNARFNPILEKVGFAGPGGALGSEGALMAESIYKDLLGNTAFSTSMHEEYGDIGEVMDRIITNSFVFSLVGAAGLNSSTDFKSMAEKDIMLNKEYDLLDRLTPGTKKYKQAENRAGLLKHSIDIANREFDDMDMRSVKEGMIQAQSVINNKNTSFGEKRAAQKLIDKGSAAIRTTSRSIERSFGNIIKTGILGKDVNLNLIEGKFDIDGVRRLADGEKASYSAKDGTINVDILSFKKGVEAHELGHHALRFLFGSDKTVAVKLKQAIEGDVNEAFKGEKFKYKNEKGEIIEGTFSELIESAYSGSSDKQAEEYVMNVVERLQDPKYQNLLLDKGLIQSFKRTLINTGADYGIPLTNNKSFDLSESNLGRASEVLEFLHSFGRNLSGSGIKFSVKKLKNVAVDGKKLYDVNTGKKLITPEEAIKKASLDIVEGDKKDPFAKAEKAYETWSEDPTTKDNPEVIGVMVGMEMEPIISKMVEKYRDVFGIGNELPDIIKDVATNTNPGYLGVPSLVTLWAKGQKLIEYIKKENPSAAEIESKRIEIGLPAKSVDNLVGMAKGTVKEASLTSYVYGLLPRRILGILQNKYPGLGKTVELNVEKADKLESTELFNGGEVGFVDTSSPIQNQRIARKKAEIVLGLAKETKDKIQSTVSRVLNSTKLKNLDAKSVGTLIDRNGNNVDVVMLFENKAEITINGVTETITARSAKAVEDHVGAQNKFKKGEIFKKILTDNVKNGIFSEMSKEAGNLPDNYHASPEYTKFVEKSYSLLKDYISQSSVNQRFPFKYRVIDPKTGEQAREGTAQGNKVFGKQKTTPAEWAEYFLGDGKTRIDGRRRSLIDALAIELGFDHVMETLMNDNMAKQIEARQKDLGVDLAENYIAVMSKNIDRLAKDGMSSLAIESIKRNYKLSYDGSFKKFINIINDKNGNPRTLKEILNLEGGMEVVDAMQETYRNSPEVKKAQAEKDNQATKDFLNQEDMVKLFGEIFKPKELNEVLRGEYELSIEEIKSLVEYLPDSLLEFSPNKKGKVLGVIASNLFGFGGRKNKIGDTMSRESFIDITSGADGKGSFGKKFKELSKETQALWEKVNEVVKELNTGSERLSLGVMSKTYLAEVQKIQSKDLTINEQKVEIEKIDPKLKKAMLKDNANQTLFYEALLTTIGEVGSKKQGKELADFTKAVSSMFLNNDGPGLRKAAMNKYIELSNVDYANTTYKGKRGDKIEHLFAKARFAADVINKLVAGELTNDAVKEILKPYNVLIGSRKLQERADANIGTTVKTSKYVRALTMSLRAKNSNLSTSKIIELDRFLNLETGETMFQEYLRDNGKKILEYPFKAEKGTTRANKSILDATGLLTYTEGMTNAEISAKLMMLDKAIARANDPNAPQKGISIFDFDHTLANTTSKVLYTLNGRSGTLGAEAFAKKGDALLRKGAEFDFSEFNEVIGAELGPLFKRAADRADKFSNKDIFVLTARMPQAAEAIFKYLKSQGLEIPMDNITGLGNSAAKAKSEFMISKAAEGYNDFYFADDAIQNVTHAEQTLKALGLKSKVELAVDKTVAYNASSKPFSELGKRTGLVFLATNIKEAEAYAKSNRGDVKSISVNESVISTEKSVLLKMKELGIDTSEGLLYEMIDSRFEDFYIGKSNVDKLMAALKADGIKGFRYKDGSQISSKAAESIVIIDKSAISETKAVRDASLDITEAAPNLPERVIAEMIERKTGLSADRKLEASEASNLGKKKGKWDFFLPPNAEDFQGLMYKIYGKGKQGDADMKYMHDKIIRPYTAAENALSSYRQNLAADYSTLEGKLKGMEKAASEESIAKIENLNYTSDQAVRVYIWNKLGKEVPNISPETAKELASIINRAPRLKAYAEGLMTITKTEQKFPNPTDNWYSSNVKYDLFNYATEGVRSDFLEHWRANSDAIFTKDNYSRMEASFGLPYVTNLKSMINRMATGKARPENLSPEMNKGLDYINGSVGVIMWMNTRSAMLQTISAVNYINWSDNNPIAIAKVIGKNPKEYAKTVAEIFNSDFLKDRRSGLRINVEEAEIAKAIQTGTGNKAQKVFNALIRAGFQPTQIADSFAITMGGAPFYMNRVKTYEKTMSTNDAKKKAWEDFRSQTEEHQQSSRMDRISNIQTGVMGRLVFAFNNTPFQMTRMQKKAFLDIKNGRGDLKTNVSKLIYYNAIQSSIFYTLQQGLYSIMFNPSEDETTDEQKKILAADTERRVWNLVNGVFDSTVQGSGLPGKAFVVAKNTLRTYFKEEKKGYQLNEAKVSDQLLGMSPPLGSKISKIDGAIRSKKFNNTKKGLALMEKEDRSAFNPLQANNKANAKIFSSLSNVPIDRAISKVENMQTALDSNNATWIRLAALMGTPKWQLENEVTRQINLENETKGEVQSTSNIRAARTKSIKDLKKDQQIDSLEKYGLSRREIRLLKYESQRVQKIKELQDLANNPNLPLRETPATAKRREDSLK